MKFATPASNAHPITQALQHVRETRRLIEALITSSESFDYLKAKEALRSLQKKTRELARLEASLLSELPPPKEGQIARFPADAQG